MPEPKDLHVDAPLTNYSQQYKNEEMIADMVLPLVKVAKRSDVYWKYAKDERFTLPDDKIGPKSEGNEVEWNVTTDNYSVEDYSFQEFVSNAEKDNADMPLDPEKDALDFLMELLTLAREKRTADLVFAAGTYPVGNKVQLAGVNQWSDETNSNPIKDILTGLDAAFMRPNIIVLGAASWLALRKHPKVLDAVKGATRSQASKGGIASREDVASLFEVDAILVGRSKRNTAKKGQSASYSRMWGKHAALLRIEKGLTPRSISFGCAFQEMKSQVFKWDVPGRGVKGGTMVKVAWNMDEKIKASDLGYFIEDATA